MTKQTQLTKQCGRPVQVMRYSGEKDADGFLKGQTTMEPCTNYIPDEHEVCDRCTLAAVGLASKGTHGANDPLGMGPLYYAEEDVLTALRGALIPRQVMQTLIERAIDTEHSGYVECPFCSAHGWGYATARNVTEDNDQVYVNYGQGLGIPPERVRRQGHFHDHGCPVPAMAEAAYGEYNRHYELEASDGGSA